MRVDTENTEDLIKVKWIAFSFLTFLQVVDYVSTRLATSIPGVVELNPLVRSTGLILSKLLVFAMIMTLVWITRRPKRLWFVCSIYTLIVSSNILLYVSHK